MRGYQGALTRGFNWLGSASIVAKAIDFATILTVLPFLTKQQVGLASVVISIGMVVEAFDGLGTGDALIQVRSVSRLQLDTLFWFIVGAAALAGALMLLAAPAIEAIYGRPGMAACFVAIAIKQPLVAAASIPLAMLNRNLRYERLALINVGATLAAALTRLGLALLGTGAWALVGGYASSGLYVLVGALLAGPFLPRRRFSPSTIRPLLRFGTRSAAAGILEQMFKNMDFLLVGWFYGVSLLGIYRVAFDVAMEPSMAVGTVINRTALPVFARVSADKEMLAQTLTWSLRRVAVLVTPMAVALMMVADPLTALLHDEQGNSYQEAAVPLTILAAASVLRITSQLLFPAMIGSGMPGLAARLSAVTMLLLSAGIVSVGRVFHAHAGIVAVSAVWFGIYPILLAWAIRFFRREWNVRVADLARSFAAPVLGVVAMASGVEIIDAAIGWSAPEVRIGIVVVAMLLTYSGLLLQPIYRSRRTA